MEIILSRLARSDALKTSRFTPQIKGTKPAGNS
jgi:hypothetical protein